MSARCLRRRRARRSQRTTIGLYAVWAHWPLAMPIADAVDRTAARRTPDAWGWAARTTHCLCIRVPRVSPECPSREEPVHNLRRSTVTDRVIQLYSNLNLMLIRKRMVEFRGRRSHSSPPCLIQKRCPLRTSLLTRIRSEWLYRPLGRPPLTLTRLTPSVRYSRTCRRAAAQTISDNDKNCMPSPSRAQDRR